MRLFIRLHHVLLRYACYPLVLSSALACAMLAGRIYLSQTWGYTHMVWNLFLAWIPFLCSIWIAQQAERHPRHSWWLLLPGMVWLIFLPNAPYMITDIRYIRFIESFLLWYDIVLIVAFAWTGCFLAVVSLHIVHTLASRHIGTAGGWIGVAMTTLLSGLGVYLGRFLRWNSWDVLVDPQGIMRDVVTHATHPQQYQAVIAVTSTFAALLMVCYLMFKVTAYSLPAPHTYPRANAPHDRLLPRQ